MSLRVSRKRSSRVFGSAMAMLRANKTLGHGEGVSPRATRIVVADFGSLELRRSGFASGVPAKYAHSGIGHEPRCSWLHADLGDLRVRLQRLGTGAAATRAGDHADPRAADQPRAPGYPAVHPDELPADASRRSRSVSHAVRHWSHRAHCAAPLPG